VSLFNQKIGQMSTSQPFLGDGGTAPTGFCPNRNFSFWAQALGVLSGALLVVFAIVYISDLANAAYSIAVATLVFIIEVPSACKCCCGSLYEKTIWCAATRENPKGCLLRGIFYAGLALGGCAVTIKVHENIIQFVIFVVLMVDGIFYMVAFCQGMSAGTGGTPASKPEDPIQAAKRAAAGAAISYARDNPDQVAAAAQSAVQYAADNPDVVAGLVEAGAAAASADDGAPGAAAWDAAG